MKLFNARKKAPSNKDIIFSAENILKAIKTFKKYKKNQPIVLKIIYRIIPPELDIR